MNDSIAVACDAATMTSLALFVCIVAECVSPRETVPMRRRFPGGLLIVLLPVCATLMAAPLGVLWHAVFGVGPVLDLTGMPAWVTVLTILLIRDFLNYWSHRLEHIVLWPVHAVHHAQTDLHAANGYAHPLQLFSEFFVITAPLSLIDTGGVALPLAVTLIVSMQAMIIHSPLRVHLGPLRRVLNDSRFHRIHHSREERHIGKNFATVFTLWDQLFGTAYFPEPDEWPEVGVNGLRQPENALQVLLYPLQFLPRWRALDAREGHAVPSFQDSHPLEAPAAATTPSRRETASAERYA